MDKKVLEDHLDNIECLDEDIKDIVKTSSKGAKGIQITVFVTLALIIKLNRVLDELNVQYMKEGRQKAESALEGINKKLLKVVLVLEGIKRIM